MSTQTKQPVLDKIKATLATDKSELDKVIAAFVKDELPLYSSDFTEFSRVAMGAYGQILNNGGKRLRASLLINTYSSFGGEDKNVALRMALAIEMVHAYLLVLDDFTDVSLLRRGSDSAHIIIEKYAKSQNFNGDLQHLGYSVAVTAGVAGMHIAANIIADLKIKEEIKLAVLSELNKCVITTAHGQINDVFNEVMDPASVSQESILNVMKWKTAQYTFFNPIQIGIMLALESTGEAQKLIDYSLNAGLAFQIQDDIIGMFGNEEETGKPAIDDLREGKITLLIYNTLQNTSEDNKNLLLKHLGDRNVSEENHQVVKDIIEGSGALTKTAETAMQYSQDAIKALEFVDIANQYKEYLTGLAEVIVNRDK